MPAGDTYTDPWGDEWYNSGICPHGTCANETWMLKSQNERLRKSGLSFYCIAGHSQSYTPKKEIDAKAERLRRAEEKAAEAYEAQQAALKAKRKAERTCTWPTCGAVLRSPSKLRQHMVDVHGAPWATPEVSGDEIAQVLNGRDQASVVK